MHTGVKIYSCDECSETFRYNGDYYEHRRKMHPELDTTCERGKYECADCGQRFGSRIYYKVTTCFDGSRCVSFHGSCLLCLIPRCMRIDVRQLKRTFRVEAKD